MLQSLQTLTKRNREEWKDFFRTHRYGLWLLYLPAYLTVFAILELFPQESFHLIVCPLDDLIPTIPAFFVPYAIWWVLFPGSLFYFYFLSDREHFLELCFILFLGYTVCLITYIVYPNGIDIREPLPGNDGFSQAVRLLRTMDVPRHVCPSMHVSSTVAICLTVKDEDRIGKGGKWFLYFIGVMILLSTMFIKQHSVVDVVCGILLSLVLYIFWKKVSKFIVKENE